MIIPDQVAKAAHMLAVLTAALDDHLPGDENYTPEVRTMRQKAIKQGRKNIVKNVCVDLLEAQDPDWSFLEPLKKNSGE
jgi:hypothetical protein